MSKPVVVKLTEESFKDFVLSYYFSGNAKPPEYHQVYFLDTSHSYAILDENEKMIGAFGIVMVWHGVGEVWFMSTEYLNRYPKWQVKTFKHLTDLVLNEGVLHRVQMNVDNENVNHHKWAQMMGFEFEGVQRKHSAAGTDHASYAKIS